MRMTLVGTMVAAAWLAGCESSDEASDLDDLRDRSDDNIALLDRIEDMSPSAAADVPLSGTATYEGFAGILLETPGSNTALIGDAEITADFATDEMEGRLDNFEGRVQGGGVQDFDGEITLSDGDIAVVTGSDFRANAGGVLTGGGDVIGVDGSIVGAFFNDDVVEGDMTVAGER